MRNCAGVPLLYIKRSVLILEPMAESTRTARLVEEKNRFRVGLKSRISRSTLGKRSREEDAGEEQASSATIEVKKKRQKGPKGPNPLSALRPKKRVVPGVDTEGHSIKEDEAAPDAQDEALKKKRRRKSSKRTDTEIPGTENREL
jgi:U3 small nucleolar RNA-associated protein 23